MISHSSPHRETEVLVCCLYGIFCITGTKKRQPERQGLQDYAIGSMKPNAYNPLQIALAVTACATPGGWLRLSHHAQRALTSWDDEGTCRRNGGKILSVKYFFHCQHCRGLPRTRNNYSNVSICNGGPCHPLSGVLSSISSAITKRSLSSPQLLSPG